MHGNEVYITFTVTYCETVMPGQVRIVYYTHVVVLSLPRMGKQKVLKRFGKERKKERKER